MAFIGKALKDKKQRTAQSAYQKEQLGDAFIDNNKLLSKAKQSAFQLAEDNADRDMIVAKANELVEEHSNETLSPKQLDTLITYIQAQVDKHLRLDRVEASIIDTDNKNMYCMWGKIKRQIVKKDTFAWTNAVAAKEAHCSKGDVKVIISEVVFHILLYTSLRYRLARLVKLPLFPFCMHLIAPSFSRFLIIVFTSPLEQ